MTAADAAPTLARSPLDLEALLHGVGERRPRALGRALSLIERDGAEREQLVRRLFPERGRATVVGVTGPSGSGKSTLVDRLARLLRERDRTVAILAIDPSSPLSGGALLGDRVRMQTLYTDPGVFIRSMATRGALGGLAASAHDAIDLLDAAGFDWVLVETVGVGQDEVDVVKAVETVVVVSVPGMGDGIQAIKAGVLEIADVFVVNKADHDGAERTVHDLKAMVREGEGGGWLPPVVETVATESTGIDALLEEVERHRAWAAESGAGAGRRRDQLELRIEAALGDLARSAADAEDLDAAIDAAIAAGEHPSTTAARLFDTICRRRAAQKGAPGEAE